MSLEVQQPIEFVGSEANVSNDVEGIMIHCVAYEEDVTDNRYINMPNL